MLQYILQFMIAFHSSPLCVFTSSRYERESFNSSVYTFTVSAIYCQSDVSNPTITPAEMVLLANMSNARNCIAEMYAYGPRCICLFTISTLLYHKSLLFVITKHYSQACHRLITHSDIIFLYYIVFNYPFLLAGFTFKLIQTDGRPFSESKR